MATTVLVTGASGLLGRQVFDRFKRSGCLTVGQGFSRANPPTIIKADLENTDEIKSLLDEAKYVAAFQFKAFESLAASPIEK
jgi:dTDP-4-dehydrorhamnose reductase